VNVKKKKFNEFDTGILIATGGLILIGLVALFSATEGLVSTRLKYNLLRQVLWLVLGVGCFSFIVSIELRKLYYSAYWVYFVALGGLMLVLLIGQGKGSQRWIGWGGVHIQPTEFAKVAVLIALSRFLSDRGEREINQLKNIALAFLIVLLPVGLIVQQPDLSSALVFIFLLLPMMYWAGLSPFVIFVSIAPIISFIAAFQFYLFFGVMLLISLILLLSRKGFKIFTINFLINTGVGVVTPSLWNHLHIYQQKRILTYLGIEIDPQGLGYQLIQSKVAIGSGGLIGKGFLLGTQTKLRFLPAQHTDFILSVIGEEFGFIGICLVLGLFMYILFKSLRIAEKLADPFASNLVIGSVCILVFHLLVNVGMTVGMMPVTGLPLPFLSYGGSFLLVCLSLVAFIINGYRKQMHY
jgi:rod shape determining protein RodA